MREIANLALKLFVITAVAALSLAFTNSITTDRIAERTAMENESARQGVLSQTESFEQVDQSELQSIAREAGVENPEMINEAFKGLKGN